MGYHSNVSPWNVIPHSALRFRRTHQSATLRYTNMSQLAESGVSNGRCSNTQSRRPAGMSSSRTMAWQWCSTTATRVPLVRRFSSCTTKLRSRKTPPAPASISPLGHGFTCELCAGIVDKDQISSQKSAVKRSRRNSADTKVAASERIREIATFAKRWRYRGCEHTVVRGRSTTRCKLNEAAWRRVGESDRAARAYRWRKRPCVLLSMAVPKTSGIYFGLVWGLNFIQGARHGSSRCLRL
jgi:hypothetical protein